MIPKKSKLTLSIDPGLNQRLDFQAARDGKGHDRSSIVDALIDQYVKLPGDVQDFFLDAPETRRSDAKSSRRQPPEAVNRDKTTFYLSHLVAKRLGHYAVWLGKDRSSIVEALIRDHVTPWDLYDPRESHLTTRRKDRQGREAQINSSAGATTSE
jgi:hypothetical protein